MIYTALTIGPIYKTLDNARHTRELWAASYTFSYLMKNIIKKLEEDESVARTFYLPYATTEELKASSRFGEGVLPDRLIYGASQGEAKTLKDVVDTVLKDFADSVATEISANSGNVRDYFQNYFRFYIVEKELPEGENPILKLSPLLNSIELQANYSAEQEKYLEEFFFKINSTFLVEDGYAGAKHVKYSTLIEISMKEFEECDKYKSLRDRRKGKNWAQLSDQQLTEEDAAEEKEDRDLIDELKKKSRYKDQFRAAHKYVAIVHADGDNIGKVIETLKTHDEFKKFSSNLSSYSRQAVEIVEKYGGMPIYAGGDDLLFFAPVVNKENHIIDLLLDLDQLFNRLFVDFKTSPAPSLSFGVSISYYKYPLFEALEVSRELLFGNAKTGSKNNIALRVLKHSGHSFGETLHIQRLDSDQRNYFKDFINMLEEHVTNETGMLSSMVYKIHENKKLFSLIGRDPVKVSNFIHNSFNEREHDEAKIYLGNVRQLVSDVFKDTTDDDKALKQIYAILRTVSFFKEKDAR